MMCSLFFFHSRGSLFYSSFFFLECLSLLLLCYLFVSAVIMLGIFHLPGRLFLLLNKNSFITNLIPILLLFFWEHLTLYERFSNSEEKKS